MLRMLWTRGCRSLFGLPQHTTTDGLKTPGIYLSWFWRLEQPRGIFEEKRFITHRSWRIHGPSGAKQQDCRERERDSKDLMFCLYWGRGWVLGFHGFTLYWWNQNMTGNQSVGREKRRDSKWKVLRVTQGFWSGSFVGGQAGSSSRLCGEQCVHSKEMDPAWKRMSWSPDA